MNNNLMKFLVIRFEKEADYFSNQKEGLKNEQNQKKNI